jgi:hypothetical protein
VNMPNDWANASVDLAGFSLLSIFGWFCG